jgi:hypothetical protein
MQAWLEAVGISTGALFREIGPGGALVAPYVDALRRWVGCAPSTGPR